MADRSTILLKRAAMVNGGSAALTFVVFLWLAGRVPPPSLSGSANRFVLWACLALWPSLILLGMVGAVIVARGLGRAFNPLTDPESPFQRVSQRVLSNSVEQTLIFLPALAALVALSPPADLGAARVAVGLFALGRLLFWGGYLIHPFWRAPGMAMTLSTTLTVLGWAVLHALA
jgi:hypothetical protein